jgi:hypothetical protein
MHRIGFSVTLALALLANGCSKESRQMLPQAEELKPEEVGALGARGFALYECAAFATWGSDRYKAKSERLFAKGHELTVQFVKELKALSDDKKELKAATHTVPMIVTMNLGGPSPDFMSGRVWSATELNTFDMLHERSGWTHQKKDPNAPDVPKELVMARAEETFRQKNCDLLAI